jgi:uncharacterized membrane protein YqjE
MGENNHHRPGPITLVRQLAATALGVLQNRGELIAVEWQEERARMAELMVRTLGFVFLAMMGVILLTGTILLLVPEDWRVYVAAGFALLYFLGALAAWFGVRSLLEKKSFSESIGQVKKDREWLESLK